MTEIKAHYVKECSDRKLIKIEWVESGERLADLTKPLSFKMHEDLTHKIYSVNNILFLSVSEKEDLRDFDMQIKESYFTEDDNQESLLYTVATDRYSYIRLYIQNHPENGMLNKWLIILLKIRMYC